MTIIFTYICDGCKKEDNDCAKINNDPMEYNVMKVSIDIHWGDKHLCEDCKTGICESIQEIIENSFCRKIDDPS